MAAYFYERSHSFTIDLLINSEKYSTKREQEGGTPIKSNLN